MNTTQSPPLGGTTLLRPSPAPVVDSSDLLQGQREILITHNGVVYRLQATRQGKLILTK
jgi:hemin uptake protein HemP